jgi:ribosomal protein L40E
MDRRMAQCAQCLYENEDEASSCEQCGADVNVEVLSLQLGQVCRHCDSYNDPGVDVCVSCGQPLGEGSRPWPHLPQ